jgi:hypothetical protein
MTIENIIGIFILGAIFLCIFIMDVRMLSFKDALIIWTKAFAFTALIVFAIYLISN